MKSVIYSTITQRMLCVASLLVVPAQGQDPLGIAAFKRLDKNNDGKLSRDEIPAALFDRLDANKDGFVSEDKLKALWRNRQ